MNKNRLINFRVKNRKTPYYSDLLAALSNSYTRSYYKRAVGCSPSLNKFDPYFPSRLVECDIRLERAIRNTVAVMVILLLALFYSYSRLAHNEVIKRYEYAFIVVSVLLYVSTFFYTSWVFRFVNEERATFKLFQIVIWLENGHHDWHDSKFRRGLARRLEVVAKMVERIPQASRGIAPGVQRDLVKISKAKAQAIRELEMLVIMPESLTFADLFDRLTKDLYTLADDRWYELPEGQGSAEMHPRWLRCCKLQARF